MATSGSPVTNQEQVPVIAHPAGSVAAVENQNGMPRAAATTSRHVCCHRQIRSARSMFTRPIIAGLCGQVHQTSVCCFLALSRITSSTFVERDSIPRIDVAMMPNRQTRSRTETARAGHGDEQGFCGR